jgi:hypothetical protein
LHCSQVVTSCSSVFCASPQTARQTILWSSNHPHALKLSIFVTFARFVAFYISIGPVIDTFAARTWKKKIRSVFLLVLRILRAVNADESMLSGSTVTTAWRVLGLRIEETASRYGG